MIALILQAMGKFFTESTESFKKFVNEKVRPKMHTYSLVVLFLAILALIPPYLILYTGIYLDARPLIIFSGVLSAVALLLLMAAVAPIMLLYYSQGDGIGAAIPRALNAIGSVFVVKLILTLIACFIPFKNHLGMVPVYLLSSFLFGLMFTQIFKKEIVAVIVALFFFGIVSSFFFPGFHGSLGHKAQNADDYFTTPQEANITCANYNDIDYFFSQNGEPKYLLRLTESGEIKLLLKQTDQPVFDPKTGKRPYKLDERALSIFKKQMAARCATSQNNASTNTGTGANTYANSEVSPASPLESFVGSNTNRSGVVDIAVFISNENGQAIAPLAQKIAQSFDSGQINATGTLFTENFATSGTFENVYARRVGQLYLESRVDYVLLGKTRTSTFMRYASEQGMELVNATIAINVVILSAKTGAQVDSFSLSKTYRGFDETEAIATTEKALALAIHDRVQNSHI